MSATDHPIFTIGHSTHSAGRFLALLRQHGIEAVADVRSSPFSHFNPQFNRENLEHVLKENGIRYVFLGKELGARTEDPSCYENGRVQYVRLARTAHFRGGLDRVTQGAQRYRIALMCAEKEPLECHRTLLVSKALVERGLVVRHIHADAHWESHEAAMDRLFNLTGVSKEDMFRSRGELQAEALTRQEERIAYADDSHAPMTLREDTP